ncbi:MAG: hypothetical protein WC688_05360 [Parachlamydiales bacterium]
MKIITKLILGFGILLANIAFGEIKDLKETIKKENLLFENSKIDAFKENLFLRLGATTIPNLDFITGPSVNIGYLIKKNRYGFDVSLSARYMKRTSPNSEIEINSFIAPKIQLLIFLSTKNMSVMRNIYLGIGSCLALNDLKETSSYCSDQNNSINSIFGPVSNYSFTEKCKTTIKEMGIDATVSLGFFHKFMKIQGSIELNMNIPTILARTVYTEKINVGESIIDPIIIRLYGNFFRYSYDHLFELSAGFLF